MIDLIFAVAVGIVLASILFAASVSDSTNVSAVNLEQIDDVNEDIFDDERYKKNNEVLVFNPIYDIDDVIRWGNGDYSKEY